MLSAHSVQSSGPTPYPGKEQEPSSCACLSSSDSGRAGTGYLAGKKPENYTGDALQCPHVFDEWTDKEEITNTLLQITQYFILCI